MNCNKTGCHEEACIVIDTPSAVTLYINDRGVCGSSVQIKFCISHMRDFYRYVGERLEQAEKAMEGA